MIKPHVHSGANEENKIVISSIMTAMALKLSEIKENVLNLDWFCKAEMLTHQKKKMHEVKMMKFNHL